MKGDFSRFTFDASSPYSRVLMQQGRVLLDADWNESAEIQTYYLRALARDLIGPHGAPTDQDGNDGGDFSIAKRVADDNKTEVKNDFTIAGGRYYVQGILCENPKPLGYRLQTNWPDDGVPFDAKPYLVYLDVWERHITPTETDDILADPALGGADTCSRAKVIWQVKVLPVAAVPDPETLRTRYEDFLNRLNIPDLPGLAARVDKPADADSPCLLAPDSRFRGTENQLYRVEIHTGGTQPTFVWSRENGSEIYAISGVSGQVVTVGTTGRDDRSQLEPDDMVELVDDAYTLRNGADKLYRVSNASRETGEVTLDRALSRAPGAHPYLRRWNSGEIDLNAASKAADNGWITLEDGVQIKFLPAKAGLVSGQYWTIPARTATGEVIWPQEGGNPAFREPQGVKHYYAPLALATFKSDRSIDSLADLRRHIVKAWK